MIRIITLLLAYSIIVSISQANPKHFNLNDHSVLVELKTATTNEKFGVAIKKARPFVLNQEVKDSKNVSVGDSLQLDLFIGKSYKAVIVSKSIDVNGVIALVAKLDGYPYSSCIISIAGKSELVTIDIPEQKEKYTTRMHPQEQLTYLVQLDETKLDILEGEEMLIPKGRDEYDNFKDNIENEYGESNYNFLNYSINHLKSAQPDLSPNDPAQIDILVVYTPTAKQWADVNEGGINNTINHSIANSNLVATNSNLGVTFNLAYSTEIDFTESDRSSDNLNFLTEGLIPNVSIIRDAVAADLVVLFTNKGDVGGVSWILDDKYGREDYAYALVRVQQASDFITMTHELGHNMGAHHHKDQNFQPGPTIWTNWDDNFWSAGWRWKGNDNNRYCDVMTYPDGWYFGDETSHTAVPYFSDPEITFQGQPTGDMTNGNNARTLREMKHIVAGYRTLQQQKAPIVYIENITDITREGAVVRSKIANAGELPVTSFGIVWSTNKLPTLNDNCNISELESNSYVCQIKELIIGATYYVRAYVTNSAGTVYSNQVAFVFTGGEQRDFITCWELPEEQDELEFLLDRTGEVEFRWETIPGGQSGSGIFSPGQGLVKITKLPPGKKIRLSIAPKNLKHFYNKLMSCPTIIDGKDRDNLIEVQQWGTVQWSSMKNAFYECTRLTITALDNPDFTKLVDLSWMFFGCKALSFGENVNDWNVSLVKKMSWMFAESGINQKIGKWDVSMVENMDYMFFHADLFNQEISNWDVSRVKDMSGMFSYALSFNQSIGEWDVSSVKNMTNMFSFASEFNQDIGKWDVSGVMNMEGIFFEAEVFNQDIGKWDVSSVIYMGYAFSSTKSFNKAIGNWNVANVKYMHSMFMGAKAFNQYIGDWDVSKVEDMSEMFAYASAFNQDIGSWEVKQVINMNKLFYEAKYFNQNLNKWNIINVIDMKNMLDNSGMDCVNYSNTLIGWSKVFNYNNPEFGASKLTYGINAECARDALISRGWSIVGDSQCGSVCGETLDPEFYITSIDPILATSATIKLSSCNRVSQVLLKGIIWGTSPNLTIENGIISEVSSLSNFASHITGLNPNTRYYVRVYGEDESGIIYGSETSFVTLTEGAPEDFVTQWKLNANQTSLRFFSERSADVTYNWVTVPAKQEGSGIFKAGIGLVEISGLPAGALISLRMNPDGLRRIYHTINANLSPSRLNLISVDQWGTALWSSFENAFSWCRYLNIRATDIPNLSNVKSMKNMFFRCSQLNSPSNIGSWDVSKIKEMDKMFLEARCFNQNIEKWNMSSVIEMTQMFFGASRFNQNLGQWNLAGVPNMEYMLDNSGIDCANYSATLKGWSNNINTPNDINLGAFGLKYNKEAISGRNKLITEKKWIIEGDTEVQVPSSASSIIGSKTVSQGQNFVTYAVSDITNADYYSWTLPPGATGESISNVISVNFGISAVSGDIRVRGKNSCEDGVESVLAITVNQIPPKASTILGETKVCQGQKGVIYTVPEIVNASSYVWTLPVGAFGSSASNTISVDFSLSANSGSISVKGKNQFGEGASSSLLVTVNPIPEKPVITKVGDVLKSSANEGNQWYCQDGLINGAIQQEFNPPSKGNYYVVVTSLGCSSEPSDIYFLTSVKPLLLEKDIKIYPNPVTNELVINAERVQETIAFEIINLSGQKVCDGVVLGKTIIETRNFAPGIYIVKFCNDRAFDYMKIIKE